MVNATRNRSRTISRSRRGDHRPDHRLCHPPACRQRAGPAQIVACRSLAGNGRVSPGVRTPAASVSLHVSRDRDDELQRSGRRHARSSDDIYILPRRLEATREAPVRVHRVRTDLRPERKPDRLSEVPRDLHPLPLGKPVQRHDPRRDPRRRWQCRGGGRRRQLRAANPVGIAVTASTEAGAFAGLRSGRRR